MGIKGLMKFINDRAPRAIKQVELQNYTGRKLAIDASMSLYQFMIAIRDGENFSNLTNEQGETTSHIAGFLNRVIRFLDAGIKPVYVFDGKPGQLKSGELLKRANKRAQAEADLKEAQEAGNKDDIKKFIGRTVHVTRKHNEDIKRLLALMGIPVVEAATDAEATCAALAKKGFVYGTGTDDADALTFGTPVQVRHLNLSEQKVRGNPIVEVNLAILLEDLQVTMDQFIDFCILCGCDYCDSIKGIGPETAFKMVKEHKDIDTIVEKLKAKGTQLPEEGSFDFKAVRQFFQDPPVASVENAKELESKEPDLEGLKKFLVEENSFSEKRFESAAERLKKARQKASQTRLENFFGAAVVKVNEKRVKKEKEAAAKAKAEAKAKAAQKRKAAAAANQENKKPKA
uniref:Flap endonuclease 1 n=1 Tax=Chromera velia CCMP2878 TaxID=1169474 RepID=A0A0G4FIY1_9ALVE|eukprot:Cvel_17286.t1-p1 / transcript=Cvel_17286.t1 / gene=Cvel_17286 / organism=Chromera_velia_CCMP2878 / gene_product=Flap endonuclease 1, putative / transcript_product=Flap endonuclease 1, putative / location=Cvel_scaffold1371:38675-41735(-) / protein_length=400 / sequence_SO=supercontig / SO=protein_coding / is_pseudo=false